MTTVRDVMVAQLSQATFGKAIRDVIRAYFFGFTTDFGFQDQMIAAFERYFEQAWAEGAAECGIRPEERTADEATRLNQFIFEQANFLPNFASQIEAGRASAIEAGKIDAEDPNTRSTPSELQSAFRRGQMWENRWGEVKALGQQMACQDRKAKWVINPAKESCEDCLNANSRVYRMSVWDRYGWRPKSRSLACHGYHCGCEFQFTDEPVTPGRPPAMMGG